MSGEASAGAGAGEAPPLDERDLEPRTPMKRLGSTRKLAAFNNIKLQLAEQSRVLEARAEASAGVAGELHEYCRRRGELEHEYARALDKLARAAHARHKEQRHKRDLWPLSGAFECWQAALQATRDLARDHAALADLYGGVLAARLQRAADDALRLHRKCRDILHERHEELAAALHAAAAAGKDHAALHADWRAAAAKLRLARLARQDPSKHKKLKALDKDLDKRRARHALARGRALRARVEYVLSLEAANATLQRYYLDDVADIILCMEVGFEAVVGRVVRCMSHAESARGAGASGAAAALRRQADALDALHDRARLLQAHSAAFSLPRPLPPAPAPDAAEEEDDEEAEPDAELSAALAARLQQLEAGARQLRAECQESAKTLDAAEAELVRQMEGGDEHWDVSALFGAGALGLAPAAPALPAPPPPAEDQEDYYLAKFRAYVACAGRLARLDTKAAALRSGAALGAAGASAAPPPSPPRRAPRAAARAGCRSLFSAAAGESETQLPRVLTECVRVIATYGLRQQGVFRVSGSQVEMQALRAAFERGEDPLRGARDASDVNSVCGLLKMYLRGARPPLLPPALAERLARLAALPEDATFAARLRGTLAALPLHSVLVLRYLFAFLAHLARHSRHNMMDAWNLAICVGPTLLAAPPAPAHQLAHQNLLNELVKRTIVHHLEVFPQDVAPHALYRAPPSDDEEDEQEEVGEGEAGEEQPDGALPSPPAAPPHEPDLSDTDEESSSEPDSGEWGAAEVCAPVPGSSGSEERHAHAAQQDPACPAPAAPPAESPGAGTPPSTPPSTPPCRRLLADSTPDLVLDLPLRPPSDSPAAAAPSAAPAAAPHAPLDAADTFAHNRDTLKKRPAPASAPASAPAPAPAPAHRAGCSAEGAEGAGGAGGSPVPERNTARVCAKFAELTLTGGSLKPALAAKPALLRRPTPHTPHTPHTPRPAPLDDS